MPSFRDLPEPGMEPASLLSPALTVRFFITSATWEALEVVYKRPVISFRGLPWWSSG